jgi:hypothetical protein
LDSKNHSWSRATVNVHNPNNITLTSTPTSRSFRSGDDDLTIILIFEEDTPEQEIVSLYYDDIDYGSHLGVGDGGAKSSNQSATAKRGGSGGQSASTTKKKKR